MPWDLRGNAGTNPNNNFLGTTDNQPLAIRTNRVERMRVTPDGNIYWGNNSRLGESQGGSIELGASGDTPPIGTPYIDFHFKGLTQDFNTRIINDADRQLTINADTLRATDNISWSRSRLTTDHGGSIELMGPGTPYIDFHFAGPQQDFNTRIINDADRQLTISADTLRTTGRVSIGWMPWGGTRWKLAVRNDTGSGHAIVAQTNDDTGGVAVAGYGGWAGVDGSSQTGIGVFGNSNTGYGVNGHSEHAVGVGGFGVREDTTGVKGEANNGISSAGIWGKSYEGWAAWFEGKVKVGGDQSTSKSPGYLEVDGYIHKGGGGFRIDHPLEPENKYLYHSFVESPDMLNVYSGNVTTDTNSKATVTLPNYFETLNQDFRYQLTVIGQFTQTIVAEEIKNNQFLIQTDRPNVKVSWQVTGVRKDPFAEMYRLSVEKDKTADERGLYIHPETYGQPERRGISYTRRSEKALKENQPDMPDREPPVVP